MVRKVLRRFLTESCSRSKEESSVAFRFSHESSFLARKLVIFAFCAFSDCRKCVIVLKVSKKIAEC